MTACEAKKGKDEHSKAELALSVILILELELGCRYAWCCLLRLVFVVVVRGIEVVLRPK